MSDAGFSDSASLRCRPQKSKGSFRSDDPTGPVYTTIHSLPVWSWSN